MYQTLCDAINNLRVLSFYYKDHLRTVEPHCYGVMKNGKEALRCYQTYGTSDSGVVPGWKLMLVDEIASLTTSREQFSGPRSEYRRGDKAMSTIYAEL